MSQPNHKEQSQSADQSPLAYILPFVIYSLIATRVLEINGQTAVDDIAVNNYFYVIVFQVIATLGLTIFFCRRYLEEFPFRFDIWGVVVGVVGFFAWVGICSLGIEQGLMNAIGLGSWMPERVGFNPFEKISDPGRIQLFLVFRFTLMVAMVPLIEELLIRGWLVRFVEDENWRSVQLCNCLLYTSPSPRDQRGSRMPSSA